MIGTARDRPAPSGPANAPGAASGPAFAAVPDAGRSHEEVSRRPPAAASGATVETDRDDRPGPWAPFNPTIARPQGRPSCR